MLEAGTEWTNIQDIVKLTFKGIYQALKVQQECIRDIETILPSKMSLEDVRAECRDQMAGKANLGDVKRTVAEIAANLEQRVTFPELKRMLDAKVDQSELKIALGSNEPSLRDFMARTQE